MSFPKNSPILLESRYGETPIPKPSNFAPKRSRAHWHHVVYGCLLLAPLRPKKAVVWNISFLIVNSCQIVKIAVKVGQQCAFLAQNIYFC